MKLAKFEGLHSDGFFYYIMPTAIESLQLTSATDNINCYIILLNGNEIHVKDTLENNVRELNAALNYKQPDYDDDRPF
jgi:hypothetical protein